MTAIGVGVSDREKVIGWEALHPGTRSRLENAYDCALAAWDRAERAYIHAVDNWEDARLAYDADDPRILKAEKAMDWAWAAARVAEDKKHALYLQKDCPHLNTEIVEGSMYESCGEAYDRSYRICSDCGATL